MINFREQYKRIGGKQLNEGPDYEDLKVMVKKLKHKKIAGFKFAVDSQTDNWNWHNPKTLFEVYATPDYWKGGTQDIVTIEAYDNFGDEIKKIPNKARYKHSGNLSRDLANYLKIVKTVINKLLYGA